MDFLAPLSMIYQLFPLMLVMGGVGVAFWLIKSLRGGRN